MALDFIGLIKRLRDEAKLSGDAESLDSLDERFTSFPQLINGAYSEILNEHRWMFAWQELEVTLVGDVYAFPDGVGDFRRELLFVNGRALDEVDFTVARRGGVPKVGATQFYAIRPNGDLVFYPSPDTGSLMNIEVWRKDHELVEAEDEPIIPPAWRDTIIWRALLNYSVSDEAGSLYQVAKAKDAERMRAMYNRFTEPVRLVRRPIA